MNDNNLQGQKAVIYARYSSHSQTEQSIEGQLHDAYEFAKRNGITVINEYIDRAISGKTEDRPQFQKMIKDAEKHQFTLVIVWKLDRFARDRYASAVYRNKLRKCGVRIVSVMENLTDGPESIILESVLEGMAEYYSANLAENIRRGQNESIRKGWFPGGCVPYGYIHHGHKLVPDPRTVPVVSELFERYAAGERPSDIVKDFNARGILFKDGRKFQISTLEHITENPAYIGKYRFAGKIVEGCAEPIISKDIFDAAVSRRNANRRAPARSRKQHANYLLLGKLFCGECESSIAGDGGTSRTGKYYFYYTCHAKKKDGKCTLKSIRKDDLEYAICKVISDFLLNKRRHTIEILGQSIFDIYRENDTDTKELSDMEKQLKSIEIDMNKLIDSLICMPESTRPRIAKRMEELETQRTDLDSRIAKKKIECSVSFCPEDFVNFIKTCMHDIKKENNQEFIFRTFLNSAYIYADGRIVIYLNQFRGLPDIYRIDNDPPPGKDGHKEGKPIFGDKVPKEFTDLPGFKFGSSLFTYAPPYADKLEPRAPHLFFLHGRVGIIIWRESLRTK